MPDFKNILVGVDFSECCVSALKEAGRISKWNHAPVSVLHVIDPVRIEGGRYRLPEAPGFSVEMSLGRWVEA